MYLLLVVFSAAAIFAGCATTGKPAASARAASPGHAAPEMVLVRGGTFRMGDETGDLWNECRPVHTVKLTYDFLIGRYQVTFDLYDEFCRATGRDLLYDFGWGREDRPVMRLTWWDMIDYCNWLSEKEGLARAYDEKYELLDGRGGVTRDITRVEGYRLPTEAEWEYAASGGHEALPIPPRFRYSGSDDIDEVAWYFGNSGDEWVFTGSESRVDYAQHGASLYHGKSTQPVGRKKPNELGIHDMSGNVWEWCHDWYDIYTEEDKINPIGPESGHVRVMRGGSWIFGANDCRVACRYFRSAYDKVFRLGFRVARTAPSPTGAK